MPFHSFYVSFYVYIICIQCVEAITKGSLRHPILYTLYSIHYTLYYTVYSVLYTMCSLFCTLTIVQCTLYNVKSTLHTAQCILQCLHSILHKSICQRLPCICQHLPRGCHASARYHLGICQGWPCICQGSRHLPGIAMHLPIWARSGAIAASDQPQWTPERLQKVHIGSRRPRSDPVGPRSGPDRAQIGPRLDPGGPR